MSMLVYVVSVVGMKDCLQTNYGDVVKFMFVPKLISFVFTFVTIWNIFI